MKHMNKSRSGNSGKKITTETDTSDEMEKKNKASPQMAQ